MSNDNGIRESSSDALSSSLGARGLQSEPVKRLATLRGRELAGQSDLGNAFHSIRADWDFGLSVGPFVLPSEDAVKHICFVGSPGSGKTVLMRLLMQSVLPLIGRQWKAAVSEDDAKKSLIAGITQTLQAEHPQDGQTHSGKNPSTTKQAASESRSESPSWLNWAFLVLWLGPVIPGLVQMLSSDHRGPMGPAEIFATFWFFGQGAILAFIKNTLERQWQPAAAKHDSDQNLGGGSPTSNTAVPYNGPVNWSKHRALIYDAKLEVLPQISAMNLDCPLIVLNPFDVRSSAWDMGSDITEPATAKQIASIFIPEEKNASQPFFSDAARHLMEGVMVAFILTRPGRWTLRDVLLALKSEERLKLVLSSSPVTADLIGTYLSNERESRSIIATLGTKLGPFDVVAALWQASPRKISLKEWLQSEAILVLGNDESYRSSLDVINRVVFKRVVELLLAQPETRDGRTWFFLDEVKEAGNLDALGRLMTKGRSVGAAVVLGFQDVDGLYESFGENQAKSILGQCATKVILRLDSPETAKWAESVFGEYEALEVKQSATHGETTSDGRSRTTGTSSTEGSNRSKTTTGLFDKTSISKGSSTSETSSESTTTTTSQGTSRSNTLAADIQKRSLVMASQFQSLPMTSAATGVNGYIAHYLGAARFHLAGFEKRLAASDGTCPRVLYRDSSEQFLQPWAAHEEPVPKPANSTNAPAASANSGATSKRLEATRDATPEENANLAERFRRFRRNVDR